MNPLPFYILFFIIGGVLAMLMLMGIEFLIYRDRTSKVSIATPKPIIMGVKDGEY